MSSNYDIVRQPRKNPSQGAYIPLFHSSAAALALALSGSAMAYAESAPTFDYQTDLAFATTFYETDDLSPAIRKFLATHRLSAFLSTLKLLTQQVYEAADMSLALWQNPLDDTDTHLRITIHSGLETDKEITERENRLFELLEQQNMLGALDFVVISQDWVDV